MLIIGHRGAAGLAPENTLESLQAGIDAGADILEFDVRLTSDSVPILSHDANLHTARVSKTTLAHLQTLGSVVLLESVLDCYFGHILLNIELKPMRDVSVVYKLLEKYIKKEDDWTNIIVSTFHVRYLLTLRHLNPKINLALLHSMNPFSFVTYHRQLNLSAIGWHRLHVNALATAIAKRLGIFTYVYTVNRPETARRLEQHGIDAVVTDYPNKMSS